MKIPSLTTAIACLILAATPSVARAEHQDHPAYLHALEDLRHARANLERRGGDRDMKWDEQTAIRQIDLAIHDIKDAAIDDGKNLQDHPPLDLKLEWGGRLRRALELLHKAERDVTEDRDPGFARGLQKLSVDHIRAAIRFTEAGVDNRR